MAICGFDAPPHVESSSGSVHELVAGNSLAAGRRCGQTLRVDSHVVDALRDAVVHRSPGHPIGLYLTGSSCDGGLQPDSDLDVLLLTRDSLDDEERRYLVRHLLKHSGRRATVRPGRPIELTSLVLTDVVPWRYPAVRDFLYGEWLRTDYEAGHRPPREVDPDLAVLLTSVSGTGQQRARVLFGPPLEGLVDCVPRADLARSVFDALPELLDNLEGDERNVLLTLARMLYTLRTGLIAPKDVAALAIAESLTPAQARTLDLAATAYLGKADDDWDALGDEAEALATTLVAAIDALRP